MPRDGSGVYFPPAGSAAVPNTTIESAKFNALVADMAQDANAPRPITAGGTGAPDVSGALVNLGFSAFVQSLRDNPDAAAFLADLGFSTFFRTLIDDVDAAAVRASLKVVGYETAQTLTDEEKLRVLGSLKALSFVTGQTLTGADLAQGKANLQAILDPVYQPKGGWTQVLFQDLAGLNGATFEIPADKSMFRITLQQLTSPSTSTTVSIRCGPAGSTSGDAGASDYEHGQSGANVTAGQPVTPTVSTRSDLVISIAPGPMGIVFTGHVGAANLPFQGFSAGVEVSGSSVVHVFRSIRRYAAGRRPKIFISYPPGFSTGVLLVEAA